MIHEVIVTTISQENIIHIAPMGIKLIDKQVVISPFRPSTTLDNINFNKKATINFIDDVRVFAGIVTKYKKDWSLAEEDNQDYVPRLALANTHYNVVAKNFRDDKKRPDITCNIDNQSIHTPFLGFNRAQFSVIEASVLVSRLGMIPMDKIKREMTYLKIGIEKTSGAREIEAWKWIEKRISEYKK